MAFRCLQTNFQDFRVPDDGVSSETHYEQAGVENAVNVCYNNFKERLEIDADNPELHRERHSTFLLKGLQHLSQSYECLDASRPWLCYWILHSMELLDIPVPAHLISSLAQLLGKCQHPDGGFGGGPSQYPHLAPTYAAVNALCILGTEEAYSVIDRPSLQRFLLRMHQPDGSFIMHDGGEVDIRGAYCAASAARLTRVFVPEMFDCTPEWIVSCQTYEGGFGGIPGMEAHGGYSFCGLAALILLGHERLCDIQGLLKWTSRRQMPFEGGFQGRTNKLVDGCYSFWQGGAFPLLHMVLAKQGDKCLSSEHWMFSQDALQEYVLICCQHPVGGLIDKPGKPRDFYHTSYCLSGLSVAQHFAGGKYSKIKCIGNVDNELRPTHPVYNIGLEAVTGAMEHFKKEPAYKTGSPDSNENSNCEQAS